MIKKSSGMRLALYGGDPVREAPWPAWPRFDDGTQKAICDTLASRRWAISGPYMGSKSRERAFAEEFARYCGSAYCTPVASGTAALTVALLALGIGAGDEVLVPGLTWVACASATMAVGAVPIMVDVEPSTLAMCPEKARQAVSPRTAAIMIVHPYCQVADLTSILRLANDAGIPVIEDCSQAHGACWNGRRVGSFGSISCFSMQQSKVLTSGEGGAIVTNNRELYERAEQIRADGRLFTENPMVGRLELAEAGRAQGHNYCLTEFQAAILLDRLSHLDSENEERRVFARQLGEELSQSELCRLQLHDPRSSPTYYNLVLRLDIEKFGGNTIDAIARAVSAELQVQVSPIYRPLNQHPLYRPDLCTRFRGDVARQRNLQRERFLLPNAEAARLNHLTLPNWVLLSGTQGIRDICRALGKIASLGDDLERSNQNESAQAF